MPQCLVIMCISYLSGIPSYNGRFTDCQINNCGIAILAFDKRRWGKTNNFQFMGTFLLSICSCCFGLTRFLKNGPMTLVPKNKYGASFCAILPIVTAFSFGKGAILGVFVAFARFRGLLAGSIAIWFGLCLLPHFVYVSITICNYLYDMLLKQGF